MQTLQVLVATMNQMDCSLYSKMNINSDALIINQCDKTAYSSFYAGDNKIEMYSFAERGLSKSRNNALMRASADIICIADDDMTYSDTYKTDILNEFQKHPEADAILFYVESLNGIRPRTKIKKFEKLNRFEYRKFSSVNIAIKREKLIYSNIWFNTVFGSGSKYNCGEDTIFLKDLLDKGFRVYKSPIKIADVDFGESTWFSGYNQEHFYNKGALIAAIYPVLWPLVAVLQSLRNSKRKLGSYSQIFPLFSWYYAGIKDYKGKIR